MSQRSRTSYLLISCPALIVILLDQITKLAVVARLPVHDCIPVIKGFFNIVHVRNRGMAFGVLNRPNMDLAFYVLVAVSIGAIILLLIWFYRVRHESKRLIFGLSLIMGGAAGNLIDRIRLREVIDFLDFYAGQYHWPAFNIADSAITLGTSWVALCLIFQRKK